MTSPHQPLPGSFFLRHIAGGRGRWVAAAQAFVRGGSYWTHAGMVLDNDQIIYGQPGGARIAPLSKVCDGQPVLFCDLPVQRATAAYQAKFGDATTPMYVGVLRRWIVAEARKLEHTKYSYLDYPVLGLAEWAHSNRWHGKLAAKFATWLREYVNRTGHLICSALVDRAYLTAGIHLFDDGRFPGDVTPQDLADYADPAAS